MANDNDWSKPQAMAIPKEGYFTVERGRYGPIFPKTPACYGFTIIAKIKPGTEDEVRSYGKTIENALKGDPRRARTPPVALSTMGSFRHRTG